jgi:peptidoglycan/LPS O-acetylase OafA/YrhL
MMTAAPSTTQRVPAFDFAKGALVLIMVLYHWLNYFVGPGHDFYRYLRFLTPSFIFITGFLISHVSLRRYAGDPRFAKKLALRGLKILGLFTLLNVAIRATMVGASNGTVVGRIVFGQLDVADLIAIYLIGDVVIPGLGKLAAFYVLLPIAYLLLVSACLLILSRYSKHVFHIASTAFLLGIFVLYRYGLGSPNLELVTIGLLGVIGGYISIERLNICVRRPSRLVVAYVLYLAAITMWNVSYPLQVVGVCLSLLVIYRLGATAAEPGRVRGPIILLGKYSLFAYIAQIAVLQGLRGGLRHIDLGLGWMTLSFLAAFGLTVMIVVAVDRARARINAVNWLYGAVFS